MKIPDNVKKALSSVEVACKERNGLGMSGYALGYIRTIHVAMRDATMMGCAEEEGLKTQIRDILNNLGWWRGSEARDAKKILKEYTL